MSEPQRPTTPSDAQRAAPDTPQRLAPVHPDRDRDSGPRLARAALPARRDPAHGRRERIA